MTVAIKVTMKRPAIDWMQWPVFSMLFPQVSGFFDRPAEINNTHH